MKTECCFGLSTRTAVNSYVLVSSHITNLWAKFFENDAPGRNSW